MWIWAMASENIFANGRANEDRHPSMYFYFDGHMESMLESPNAIHMLPRLGIMIHLEEGYSSLQTSSRLQFQ